MPTSAPCAASTARQLPSPAAITNRNADSISMTVCRTTPPPKCSLVPLARLWKAAAATHRYSESSRVMVSDDPTARPSRDKITALVTVTTRATRSSSSQSSRPGWRISSLLMVGAMPGRTWVVAGGLVRRLRSHRPAELPATLHRGHRGPGRLGRGGGGPVCSAARASSLAELRRKARLAHADGQPVVLLDRACGVSRAVGHDFSSAADGLPGLDGLSRPVACQRRPGPPARVVGHRRRRGIASGAVAEVTVAAIAVERMPPVGVVAVGTAERGYRGVVPKRVASRRDSRYLAVVADHQVRRDDHHGSRAAIDR